MRIHKETIASELQLLIDGVNTKEQALEEIAAYIRWRDKQLTIPVVVGRSEQLKAEVFTLANKLAVAGEGDAAVAMHRIHNRL